VEDVIKSLSKKLLDYVSLQLDYRTKGKVKLSMLEHIKKLIDELPDNMEGTTKTPTSNHLFMTNEECEKLPERMAQFSTI